MWPSDEQWVRGCLEDRPDAFRHLVERHQGALLGYLTGRLGSRDEAPEAAQEVFVRAFFALRKLQKPGSFFAWLLGIADRVAKEMLREQKRRPAPLTEDRERWVAANQADPPDFPGTEIAQAVAALPEAHREVILLRYYGGLSCTEISHHLAIPLGTVTKRLSRAYAQLRDALRKQGWTSEIEARQ